MTQPGLIEGLPGGHAPLMNASDVRLRALLQQDNLGLFELLKGPRTHKVGIAFEVLILWGLEQALGYTCLGRDVQIQDGKRTMGALDLVVRAPDGAVEHWELAYKLFLQRDGGTDWSSWFGPRGRDRLDAKLQKMLHHQLPMSEVPEALPALTALGVHHIDRHRLMMQGVLFSPWGSPPQRAVQGHQQSQGRWLYPAQLSDFVRTHPTSRWIRRHKPLWFGPTPQDRIQDAVSTEAMADIASTVSPNEPQLWTPDVDTEPQTEHMYFFVHEGWGRPPAHASESTANTK